MRRFAAVAAGQLVSIIGSSLTEFAVPLWIYQTPAPSRSFALFAVLALVPGMLVAAVRGCRRRPDTTGAGSCSPGTSGPRRTQLALGVLLWTGNSRGLARLPAAGPAVGRADLPAARLRLRPPAAGAQTFSRARQRRRADGQPAPPQLLVPLVAVGLHGRDRAGGHPVLFDVVSYGFAIGRCSFRPVPRTMAWQRRETLLAEIVEGFRILLGQPGFPRPCCSSSRG